ncbi:prostatic acid phosphatase-like isoform X2 [Oculina patagonica]
MDGHYLYLCFFVGFLFCSQHLTHVTCEAQRKLVMVNVVYRHGDRSPTHIYATDPYQEDVWPQGMGMLTQKGMRQEYGLGKMLKSRYVDHYKLLNASYIHREIYVRSTDIERTLMSAQTQLNGLYPPKGHQIWRDNLDWQPIGIHVVPIKEDYLLAVFDYPCPRFFQLLGQDKKQPGYIKMSLQYKDLLNYVSENSGEETDVTTMFKIRDPLICEKSHNMTLPDWVLNDTTYEDIGIVSDYSMKWNFNTREKARLTGGALVGRMIDNMKLHSSPQKRGHAKEPVRKVYLYSAHDTTLSAFMSALQVFDGISPDYSSAVMVELFSSGENELDVRVMYRFGQNEPRALVLPGCEEFCPLDKFIELTHDVIPKDIVKECAVEQERCTCVKVINYNPKGCFKEGRSKKAKVFPKTFGVVKNVDRKNPDVKQIFSKCKELAEKAGYEIFAIQKINKCVTSEDGKAVMFAKYGKSSDCIEDDDGNGVGKSSKTIFVYSGLIGEH